MCRDLGYLATSRLGESNDPAPSPDHLDLFDLHPVNLLVFPNLRGIDVKLDELKPEDLISLFRSATMCILAGILVIALCATLFFKNYADPTVLVTIVGATNLLLGYLAGKRSPEPATSVSTDQSATVTVEPTPKTP